MDNTGFAGKRLTHKQLIALKADAIPVVILTVGGKDEDWMPDFDKALEEWEAFLKARDTNSSGTFRPWGWPFPPRGCAASGRC